jgi:NADPH:quinone reductase-like Zn-dependent oxidoreductase
MPHPICLDSPARPAVARRRSLLQRAAGCLAALATCACTALPGAPLTAAESALPATQQQYQLVRAPAVAGASAGAPAGYILKRAAAPVRMPGAHEVLVHVHAASLNRRDLFVMKGQYPMAPRDSLVPLSDGAGEVVAVGPGTTRFHKGDRVAAIFFQRWLRGAPPADTGGSALGADLDGMLTQYITLSEEGLVALPASLSYEEGATLPCAGLTAWNGLVTRGHTKSGDYVLLEGTGGVSTFGLQFAQALGAKPIITSSSDAKLAIAKGLGAAGTVNYKATPEWEKAVLPLTGGHGVDEVLEVGGRDTLGHALAILAPGAHVALIGGLGGFGADVPSGLLMQRNLSVSGIYVGSRENFEAMNAFIARHHLKPSISKAVEFDDAPAAYDLMASDAFTGKIVIRIP